MNTFLYGIWSWHPWQDLRKTLQYLSVILVLISFRVVCPKESHAEPQGCLQPCFLIYWYPPQNWLLHPELSFSCQEETRMLRRKGNRSSYPPSAYCKVFTLSTHACCDGNCWRQATRLDGPEVWSNLSISSVTLSFKSLCIAAVKSNATAVLYFLIYLSNDL